MKKPSTIGELFGMEVEIGTAKPASRVERGPRERMIAAIKVQRDFAGQLAKTGKWPMNDKGRKIRTWFRLKGGRFYTEIKIGLQSIDFGGGTVVSGAGDAGTLVTLYDRLIAQAESGAMDKLIADTVAASKKRGQRG